jgi:hypothetical protein
MMILSPGVHCLAVLMQMDRGPSERSGDDLVWLLFGPTDPRVTACVPQEQLSDTPGILPLAAE